MDKKSQEKINRAANRAWKKYYVLMREKKIKEAFKVLEDHVKRHPLDVGTLIYLATRFEKLKMKEAASQYFILASRAFSKLELEGVAKTVLWCAYERLDTPELLTEVKSVIPCRERFARDLARFDQEFPQAKMPAKKKKSKK